MVAKAQYIQSASASASSLYTLSSTTTFNNIEHDTLSFMDHGDHSGHGGMDHGGMDHGGMDMSPKCTMNMLW